MKNIRQKKDYMAVKNIQNKYIILFLLCIILIIYILNNTISAYKYIYNDNEVISRLYENKSWTKNFILYNSEKDGKWLHHMNSADDVNHFQNKSKLFEVDILIHNNDLYTAHDETELQNNITLKEYLLLFNNLNDRKFWFDIKNINTSNYMFLVKALNNVLENHQNGLLEKSNIILEIGDLSVLKLVYDAVKNDTNRYRLSWYFPDIDLKTEEKAVSIINKYAETDSYFFDYISSDIKYYNILEKAFPNRKKLFWYTGGCIIERKYKRMLLYHYAGKNKNTEILLYPACL